VTRKFSLKDNPIFQRLEVPRRQEADSPRNLTEITPLVPGIPSDEGSNIEGQKESRKNFPSKFDAQKFPLKKAEDEREFKFDPVLNVSTGEKQKSGKVADDLEVAFPKLASSIEVEEDKKIEEQNLTLKYRPSNIDPQNSLQEGKNQEITESPPVLTQENGSDKGEEPEKGILKDQIGKSELGAEESRENCTLNEVPSETEQQVTTDKPEETFRDVSLKGQPSKDLGLKDNLNKSLFFSFYNEVNDELLPTLDAAEQILYSRLFRLSYGFNRNYCTVSQPVLSEKTGLSRNTIRTGLQSLAQKEWISIIEAGNHISTTYRVYLPSEKISGSNFDPQKQTLKNRPSNNERHNLSGKFRSSKTDKSAGQKTAVQNLSGKQKMWKYPNQENNVQQTPPNFDPQKMHSLLLTNNSFTLSRGESEHNFSDEQALLALAQKLVEKFYSSLAQRPSTAKREKSVAECLALLRDGFSWDQIDYAITWLIYHHPSTGSFSRVAHFIDQALKAKEEEEFARVAEGRKSAELERKRLEEKRIEEQEKQIDEVKASLSQEEFDTLYQKASHLVENEHGQVRFGKETLIQIKVRELIRARYLQSARS
jgi:Helix-turn-helix domain